jgi:hypothetical protein
MIECVGCGHDHECTPDPRSPCSPGFCHYYCPACIAWLDQYSAAVMTDWEFERIIAASGFTADLTPLEES